MRASMFGIMVVLVGACADDVHTPPALEVRSTPSGYYGLTATLLQQDCVENPDIPDPYVLDGRLEIYPRADLTADVYYLRFEMFVLWTPNFVKVAFDDGAFEAREVAPNFDRPETAEIRGRIIDGLGRFTYTQDRPQVGAPGENEYRPACRIIWQMEVERDRPAFEAVFELEEQDCYEDMDAYAHGFLMTADRREESGVGVYEFSFDSGNWWERFTGVEVGPNGDFDHAQPSENPYQPETKQFTGNFDGQWLRATYVQDREYHDDPLLGEWPECRIVWNVSARLIE